MSLFGENEHICVCRRVSVCVGRVYECVDCDTNCCCISEVYMHIKTHIYIIKSLTTRPAQGNSELS